MLSVKHNFLFIHVPKTGGNSIQSILSDYSEDEIVASEFYHDNKERFEISGIHPSLRKHSRIKDYRALLDRKLYDRLFKFSTIRNPWERLISLYFTPSSNRTDWSREIFLRLVERTDPVEQYIALPDSLWSRVSGKVMAPIDRDLDYLIRYENLDDDFRKVCVQSGLPEMSIPTFNKSKRAHYSEYYDDALVDVIYKKFRQEIDWAGYTFEEIL